MPQVFCNLIRPSLHANHILAIKSIGTLSDQLINLLQKDYYFVYEEDIRGLTLERLEANGWDVILQNVNSLKKNRFLFIPTFLRAIVYRKNVRRESISKWPSKGNTYKNTLLKN